MAVDLYGGRIPRPAQRQIIQARERFIVAAGNRYPGKTTASLWKVMDFCIANPGVEGFIGRWHKVNLYGTTIALWRECFPLPEWSGAYSFQGNAIEPDYIKFNNGSIIHLLPLQSSETKLRGGNFSFGLIDQMEECPKSVWTQAVACVRGPVWKRDEEPPYDFILDRYNRKQNQSNEKRFLLATVNKTREWYWIKRLFKEYVGVEEADRHRYRLIENRWDENKEAVAGGYYRDLEANATSKAQVMFEVYGEDPSEFGLVFPSFMRRVHMKKFEFSDLENPSYFLGYDEGFDAPSAFLFVAITPNGSHYVRAEHYAPRMTIRQHKNHIYDIAHKIGFPLDRSMTRFIADRAIFGKMDGNGVPISDQWGVREFPWESGVKDPAAALEYMRTLMEFGEDQATRFILHEQDCPNFAEELEEAYYDENHPGKMLKRCKNHAIDSFSYLALTARTPHAVVQGPSLDGTWKQFHQARPGFRSWLAPSKKSSENLFLPRARRGASGSG